MPTSRRTSSIFLRSLVSSLPSTTILPFWCSSSRLMQRIIVDLPEPDGPQMTMRSPRMTFRLMSFSTWKSPYHLCMATISMATSVSEMCIFLTSTLISSALTAFSVVMSQVPVLIVCGRCRAGAPCRSNSATCRSRTARRRSRRRQGRSSASAAMPSCVSEKLWRTMPSRSNMPMMLTRLVSLNRPMKVLTMPGMTSFSACGSTISPIFCQ